MGAYEMRVLNGVLKKYQKGHDWREMGGNIVWEG